MNFNPFKSKTILGALMAILGWLLAPETLAVLPDTIAAIVQAIGMLLGAIGARDAIATNGVASTAVKADAANN